MNGILRTAVLAAVVVAAALPVAGATAAKPSALVVQTRNGAVVGVVVGAEKQWRGIPYAAPPVGALRWRPPAPAASWSGVRDATAFHEECAQPDFVPPDFHMVAAGTEDCLYLNVFTPSTATSTSNLPVMVHLHPGGNFFFHAYEDAPAFTARGVITVTLAYRLGAFGTFGHPQLTAEQGSSGEYFMLDQLAALKWVHDNIAAFGGNPGNVTLFGSSAGSFDTAALMASPLSAGLIQRAAVQGIAFWALTGETNLVQDRENDGLFLAAATGCSSAANPVACLRALPTDQIVLTVGGGDVGPTTGGKVLPRPIPQLLATRTTVPLLVGFDREEDSGAFACPPGKDCPPDQFFTQSPNAAYSHGLTAVFGPNAFGTASGYYPISGYDDGLWAAVAAQTDAVRGCATRRLANGDRAPVWRYLYTHRYENDPIAALFRAGHVMEDPFLWGADVFDDGYVRTPAEEALAGRLADYWTNFAKTGNPNGSGQPTWPQYNTTSEPTLVLDEQVSTVTNYHDRECSFVDTIDPFPPPWGPGNRTGADPAGFLMGRAHAIP